MDFTVFFSSSVVAAFVSALVFLRNNERKIQIENITQERTKWRKAVRELADEIIKAAEIEDASKIESLCAQLSLNLNPFDSEDKKLVHVARGLESRDDIDIKIEELVARVSLLLKHDWERAKHEAKPWPFRGNVPRRVTYCEFLGRPDHLELNRPQPANTLGLFSYFAMLALSAGVLFFLAAALTEPFKNLVLYFNDSNIEKPLAGWAQFFVLSAFVGTIWTCAYLWFKCCEKRFLAIWYSKQ